tara:strand:- start:1742 stop:2830 length:1089 start_codon:yes stop_codon:yes gene_type:complete
MASSYTLNTGIEKPATGEQAGTWGTTTNTNFDIIDRALNGVGAITLSGTTHTLTTSDGSLSDGMFKVLVLGGTPSGTNTITVSPNDADKLYFVLNSSGQSATFSQGSGANVTVANGKSAVIFCDGAGSGAAVTDLTSTFVPELANDASPVLGGTLTTNGNVIQVGDSGSSSDDRIQFGAGQDLELYHNGSASYVDNNTGHLYLRNNVDDDDGGNIYIQAKSGEDGIVVNDDGAVQLYNDNSLKAATSSTGFAVTGTVLATTSTASVSGSTTLDFETNQNFILTLTGPTTLANPSTEQAGQSGFIIFIQDGTGSRSVSLGTDYETAGAATLTLSSAANAVDIVPYVVQSSGNILLGKPQLAFA